MNRVCLVVCCCCGCLAGAQNLPYGARNEYVTPKQMQTILNASIANILAVNGNWSAAAGVTTTQYNAKLMPSYAPSEYAPFTATQAANVKSLVATAAQAVSECIAYYPCAAVHVYTVSDLSSKLLVPVYYSNQTVRSSRAQRPPNARSWVATALLDRRAGLECVNDAVDPVWFFRTYAGAFSGAFLDPLDVGISHSGASNAMILANAALITSTWQRFWHLLVSGGRVVGV